MGERSAVRLYLGLALLFLAALCLLVGFVLAWPALAADQTANHANLRQWLALDNDCQAQIVPALAELPAGAQYDPASNAWSLVGITGERRYLQIREASFALIQVYYHRVETNEPGMVWAALNLQTGDGQQVSALENALSPQAAQHLFQPGQLLVRLGLSGRFVSSQGVDCAGWQARDFAGGFPVCAVEQLQAVGASSKLIAGFAAPADPQDGFVFWQVEPLQRLDLCRPLRPQKPR